MYRRVKGILDRFTACILLLVFSPLLAMIALAIKLDSQGPVIFKQQRLGQYGNPFTIYKFRSMTVGAEAKGIYATKGDARITRVGKLIRATSLDELPQLWNIAKGEMSIIGPRPPLTYHPWPIEGYSSQQKRRFDLKPGVTGWAQVNGRKGIHWNQRIVYDLEYLDKISFCFDIRILILTIGKVIMNRDNENLGKTN